MSEAEVDMPEGAVWRKVRMSETLFRLLGADRVIWGEPDEEGFYCPTVLVGPDGNMRRWDSVPAEEAAERASRFAASLLQEAERS